MSQLVDFLPLLIFFVAFKVADIYVATGALMITVVLQTAYLWRFKRAVSTQQKVLLLLTLVFGSATLLLHDQRFLLVKPTIVEWVMAAGLIGQLLVSKKPLLQGMFEAALEDREVAPRTWKAATWMWATFLFGEGILNLYVAFYYPLETWVAFKTFGLQILGIGFAVFQVVFLWKAARPREVVATAPAEEAGPSV